MNIHSVRICRRPLGSMYVLTTIYTVLLMWTLRGFNISRIHVGREENSIEINVVLVGFCFLTDI